MKLEDARDLVYLRFAAWRDQLTASDPERIRLRYAARVTLSVALALFVLFIFARVIGQGLSVVLLGVAVSFQASFVVNDPEPRQQRLTMLLLPLPAAAAATLGVLLAPSRYLGDAGFVGVAFAAMTVRRFGPCGMALGMLGLISYFYTLFAKATFAQLPWRVLAILLGTACSYLMHFAVLTDEPEERLERTLRALNARVSQVIEAVLVILSETDSEGADRLQRRGELRRLTDELGDTALRAEVQLNAAPLRSRVEPGLFVKLFDLELAARRLVIASTDETSPHERLLPTLRGLREVLHRLERGQPGDALESGLLQGLPEDRLGLAVRDLAAAIAAMPVYGRGEGQSPAHSRKEGDSSSQGTGAEEGTDEAGGEGLSPYTRQAIQVTLASTLAIIGGELISPSRWYWAAFTSIIVFIGADSRGKVLVKGWQRVLGTLAGVVAGAAVASVIHGERKVALFLILVCIFLAFYFIRVSYALMIFWFTILLALLYVALGYYHPHVLLLRLEEIALGAVLGILVALWVLPTRTRAKMAEASREFLSALGEAVESFACYLVKGSTNEPTGEDDGGMAVKLRELDVNLQKLRDAAAPHTRGLGGALEGSSTHHWLRALVSCRYEAHNLAQLQQLLAFPSPARSVLTRLALRLRDDIRALSDGDLDSSQPPRRPGSEVPLNRKPLYKIETALRECLRDSTPDSTAQALAAARCLKRMEQTVAELKRLAIEDHRSKNEDSRSKIKS